MASKRSGFLAALAGGIVSAIVVVALLLATGAIDTGDSGDMPVQAVAGASTEAEPSVRELFDRARGAIVRVDARPRGRPIPRGRPTRDDGVATGTGFLIDREGAIVTNEHVVEGGPLVTVQFSEGAQRVRAKLIAKDVSNDLALLRIPRERIARGTKPLPLADSRSVHVGDAAIALGNPFGLQQTLTLGVVSGTGREIEAPDGSKIDDAIQTDAAINPGSSGGPLLDARGRVIGVNSQAEAPGIGYAVSVDAVKKLRERG